MNVGANSNPMLKTEIDIFCKFLSTFILVDRPPNKSQRQLFAREVVKITAAHADKSYFVTEDMIETWLLENFRKLGMATEEIDRYWEAAIEPIEANPKRKDVYYASKRLFYSNKYNSDKAHLLLEKSKLLLKN